MYEYQIKLSVAPSCKQEFHGDVHLTETLQHTYIGWLLGAVLGLRARDAIWGLLSGEPMAASFNETVTTLGFDKGGRRIPLAGSETELTAIQLELQWISASATPIVLACNGQKIFRCGLDETSNFMAFTVDGWTTVVKFGTQEYQNMFFEAVSLAMQDAQPTATVTADTPAAPKKELPLHGTDEEHIVHPPVPKAPPAKPENKERTPLQPPENRSEAYKAALDAAAKLDIKKVHAMLAAVGMIPDGLTVFDLYRKVMICAIDAIDVWYDEKGGETVIPLKYDDNVPAVFYARTVDMFGKRAMQVEFVPAIGSATFRE